ncbi:IucA/IucC family siderophore biosynthesis protein [Halomicrobium mukohataei]|uniref:IucA/IucC family siderophore biosynthesis protein n=1 Tax=Halomicrobium mukohataei TaxID=57705 RepID=A0A847UCB4_9EURY|nr:IucA/IucC family protein [Halomicrobium mukohataei]NLV08924.1 IucA/IucC family siderophore biosynthesis protein [Halomicrobium mukohataei]
MTRLTRHHDDLAREIARHATTHSFLNCYCHETASGEFRPGDETPIDAEGLVLYCPLEAQGIDLYAPVAHRSPTGRHLFETPVQYRVEGANHDCDYLTLATLLTKELELTRGGDADRDELLARVVSSCRATARFVDARRGDDALTDPEATFREAEQSLVFGHLMHPTPKSRRGMGRDGPRYAPELGTSFSLHYVSADSAVVDQDSTREHSAAEWVASALRDDPTVADEVVDRHVDDGRVLLPLHPWQAQYLLDREPARSLLDDGRLESLGPIGREFAPTSSVRTLYAPESPFMVKGSLAVKITNAERTNKRPELDRGVAISELLDTELGDAIDDRFPAFDVIRDPAYLTVQSESAESGFEVVLRENPFAPSGRRRATPVAALCQDGIAGPSRLERVVRDIAQRTGHSPDAVSVDWFEQYLETAIRPVLWLFLEWGLGLEAHQQNTVLTLDDDGYPDRAFYRDNQGYYFPEGAYDRIDAVCPGVGQRADTICPDAVADERIRYYVVLNNAFGVINAFGTAGLVDERRLLEVLRDHLSSLRQFDRPSSSLLDPLLESETVPRKANLLTRFRGLDELDAPSLDDQSVYAAVPNPLVETFPPAVMR